MSEYRRSDEKTRAWASGKNHTNVKQTWRKYPLSRRHPDVGNSTDTTVSLIISHTPMHANKHNWVRQFSHDYVNQISLHYGCCIIAPSIIHRCSDARQGAASTSSNHLLISRAPLHLWISVSHVSGRTFRARGALHTSWRNRLNLSWVLCLRDSQRDVACYVRSEACVRTRAPILVHLGALPVWVILVHSVRKLNAIKHVYAAM